MAKLILSIDGEVAGNYFIDAPSFSIGSLPENNLQLAYPGVSRRHAVITSVGNDDILEDLDSTNGTRVNGNPVKRHILQHDDVIEIGSCQIRYRSQKAVSGPSLDRTMVIKGLLDEAGKAAPALAGLERVAAKKAAQQAKEGVAIARVKIMKGPQAGREIELSRVLATFGKAGEQVVVINRRPHGYFITHVEGRKPALLNGKSIGQEPRPLAANDVIRVGGEELLFLTD